jgi:serine/threonine protein kinase
MKAKKTKNERMNELNVDYYYYRLCCVVLCCVVCVCVCVNRELPPHPNVVQFLGISIDGPQPVIVMEYCTGGTQTERERTQNRESVISSHSILTHTHTHFV